MNRRLFLVLLFVLVDVLGFNLILPLLPFYAETFRATPAVVGLLLATDALTQLVGAPILGRLSDRYDRRPLLILSIAGTVVGFLLLGWANSLFMLFVSRAVDGLLGGNIALALSLRSETGVERVRPKVRGNGLEGGLCPLRFTWHSRRYGAAALGSSCSAWSSH